MPLEVVPDESYKKENEPSLRRCQVRSADPHETHQSLLPASAAIRVVIIAQVQPWTLKNYQAPVLTHGGAVSCHVKIY